ncbi:hypothetical protein HMPREF9388_0652 [Streptococcus sanguinis SK353]|uniref:Uncharacterized protein n=1 Tax=Streptococcus sanguinis SK353 TaxID=888815 RepID=F0FD70_STRSA|nr:hypothetical protein HMPREF9388_0652 [Streptococcus sanguinis SK353]
MRYFQVLFSIFRKFCYAIFCATIKLLEIEKNQLLRTGLMII